MSTDLSSISYIKVHPGIGMARVGNSEEYFVGPESPGYVPNQGKPYKDSNNLIKPQAAKFRVYGYNAAGEVVAELNNSTPGVNVSWDVHMQNMKAANYAFQGRYVFNPDDKRNPGVQADKIPAERTSLIINPGPKTISGSGLTGPTAVQLDGGSIFSGITNPVPIPSSLINKGEYGTTNVNYTEKEVSLGRLETDSAGRLIIVGGKGDAGCLIDPPTIIQKGVSEFTTPPANKGKANSDPTSNGNSYFNNPGWYDDTGGGTVNATVTINGTPFATNDNPEHRGWISVAPPKYVPSMKNVVSLLDLQLNMFPEQDPVSGDLFLATLGSNDLPQLSELTNQSPAAFSPIPGVTTTGQQGLSMTSLADELFIAYLDTNGNVVVANSTDSVNWTSTTLSSTPTSAFAPSICTFNGELYIAITVSGGGISVGHATPANLGSISFTPVTSTATTPVAIASSASPAIAAFNGNLFIAYNANGTVMVGQQDTKNANGFGFTNVTGTETASTAPTLCTFFGQLYMAYGNTASGISIGSYNTSSPQATPPIISFDYLASIPFSTTVAPAISSSHGKLYCLAVNASNQLNYATGEPGFTSLTFQSYGTATTTVSPALINRNNISFYRDILPILKSVTDYSWVNHPAFVGHAPGSQGDFLRDESLAGYSNPDGTNNIYRQYVFRAIRPAETLLPNVPPPPVAVQASDIPTEFPIQSGRFMPHLYGDGGSDTENQFNGTNHPNQWLSLTPHQLWKFQEWVNGNFTAGREATPTPIDSIPMPQQPQALDFGALFPTVGGGFHPGIELTYYMKIPGYFAAPFRVASSITGVPANVASGLPAGALDLAPGALSGYMSIPWQGDFWSCNISWWAAQRPDIVVTLQGENPPMLIPKPWFRGEAVGIPENADSIDGYEGGYDHMARYWSDFGIVVPTTTKVFGNIQLEEQERSACLDDATAPCAAVNPGATVNQYPLGAAQPANPSQPTLPHIFYTNTVEVLIPQDTTKITLAENAQGTGQIFVDDEVTIYVGSVQVYQFDYSHGNSGKITPNGPTDLTTAFTPYIGKTISVTIKYTDLYPNSNSASAFFLILSND